MAVTTPEFHTLANGLRVAFWPQTHLHSLGIGLYVGVGSRYENFHNNGVSHFLEHVMFRGNNMYPTSLDINKAIESWGGSFNAYTSREETQYFARLHPDFLEKGLEFFGAFIASPNFSGIEQERGIILEERLEDVNEDGQDLELYDINQRAFWGGHALGLKILGIPDTIKRLGESHLREHFETFYGASNTVLVLTGSFSPETALPLVETYFGSLRSGERRIPAPPPEPAVPYQRSGFVSEDEPQVELSLALLTPAPTHPDFSALQLAKILLGSGMSSRLYNRIVDELGLCYDVWAEMDVAHDLSFLDIGATASPSKCLTIIKELAGQLARLRSEEISEEELHQLQQKWRFQQEFMLDSVSSLNERIGVWTLYDRYVSHEQRQEQILQWTPASLKEVWSRWLTTDKLVLSAVGNLSKKRKRSLKEALQEILG